MRVLLVANYAPDRQESMLRFAEMMRQGLLSAGHEVRVIQPPPVFGARFTPSGAGKWLGYADKFLLFPRQLRNAAQWADIVHICDHSNAMYASRIGDKPSVVTCHDMLAIRGALGEQTDCPPSWTGTYLQRWILSGLRHASYVACVSTATADDVTRLVRRPASTTVTILNGLNYAYQPMNGNGAAFLPRVPGLNPSKPFVLHVGHNHPRKNKAGVIRSFAIAAREVQDLQLILAGPPLTAELNALVSSLGIQERVIVAVKPSNEILQALYSAAVCLLFPSRFEGFGWPLIEAQACGCPVVCSRCAPFQEIVGDTALVHDVDDEAAFAADLVRLAKSPAERQQLSLRGLQNAARFAPACMIDSYVELYRKVLAA